MPTPIPPTIRIRAFSATEADLLVYGDIGESWSLETVTAADVARQLQVLSVGQINVRINSYGGSVADGLAIYNALRAHPARKVVTIEGVAVSIASLIAMAGDEVLMPAASLMMIHAPWGAAQGNAQDMRDMADVLDTFANAMADAYVRKSGQPKADVLALLQDGADHWYTAEEAARYGFADRVLTESEAGAAIPAGAASFHRFLDRAPARIAASLRPNASGASVMPEPLPTANAQHTANATTELQRREEIMQRCGFYLEAKPHLRASFNREVIENPNMTPEQAAAWMLARIGSDASPSGQGAHVSDEGDFIAAATDALLIRNGFAVVKPHSAARDFARTSLMDIARASLSRAGRSHGDLSGSRIIKAAMSTSDFPEILANTTGRALRNGFEAEPSSHRAWVRGSKVADFKAQSRPVLGAAPDLKQVPELAEYEEGSMAEGSSVSFAVQKFGRIIRLSLEAIKNDDLGAFLRVAQAMGQAAKRCEADQVYALFSANSGNGQTMQDANPLFHATHSNVGTSSVALDAAALGAARTLLRKQTGVGGGLLNLVPRTLLVPAELEQAAETLLAASARAMNQGSEQQLVAPWISNLQLVVEPRLASGQFFLLADSAQIDTVELATLSDQQGPQLEEDDGFEVDAHRWKIRHVFGARFLDWRGISRTPITG